MDQHDAKPMDDVPDLPEARRMAETFVEVYEVTLIRVEQHLEDMISEAGEAYADGYKPWHDALHDLLNGSYQLAKENAVPDGEKMDEALRVFSFDSSIAFIKDVCEVVGIKTDTNWQDHFRTQVQTLKRALLSVQKRKLHLPQMG